MATTPVAFLFSHNGNQLLFISTFSISGDAYQYSGQWNAGVFHGQGSYLYDNGDRYVGEWKNGQKHGYGTYTWANGNKWIGHFRHDRSSGEGVIKSASQHKFKHRFKRGQKVRHWKFGRGSIVSMRGNHAQVRFESVGTKWLVLTYADLAID